MSSRFPLTLLDGAMGTEMIVRGAPCDGPSWNANAIESHASLISDLHSEYADAVLVNCVAASRVLLFISAISQAVVGRVAVGVYANAGTIEDGLPTEDAAWEPRFSAEYVRSAEDWIAAGATIIGGCCGTNPRVIKAITHRLGS